MYDQSKNLIIICCDKTYYKSLLLLLNSLIDYNRDELIMLFDIGLTKEQVSFLRKLRINIIINNLLPHLDEIDKKLKIKNCYSNISTYGFKSYILRKFDNFIPDKYKHYELNVLYLDSGFYITQSLEKIFEIIHNQHIFVTDHSDCPNRVLFHGNEFYEFEPSLSNQLPPSVYNYCQTSKYINLTKESLKKQYIKAGLVGYKYKGKYQFIINENFKCFHESNIWNIEKETDNTKFNYYNEILNDNDPLLKWTGTHRYDQTILSTLINSYNITSKGNDYGYVIGQLQNINSLLFNFINFAINNHILLDEFSLEKELNLFTYSLKEVKCQQTFLHTEDQNVQRKIFSKNDILWKYIQLLPMDHNKYKTQIKNLYHYLLTIFIDKAKMYNTCSFKINIEKILLIKNKTFVLHRGMSLINYSILNKINYSNKKLFILGNGPSLSKIMNDPNKLQVIRNNHSFGLNAAYRAYERYNFYPTYFGCFDYIVNDSHKTNFENLVLSNNPIQEFFFIGNKKQKQNIYSENVRKNDKFTKLNFIERSPEEKNVNNILAYDFDNFTDMLTSGTNSVQVGILKGYKEIILLGCDCNYTEVIEKAEVVNNAGKIVMSDKPITNPNYWFDDYQIKGDEFNIPNTNGCQLPAWDRLYSTMKELNINVKIVNVNDNSAIQCFEKQTIDDFFNNN